MSDREMPYLATIQISILITQPSLAYYEPFKH